MAKTATKTKEPPVAVSFANKKVRNILDRYGRMKTDKQPWIGMWSLVAQYVMSRQYPFVETSSQSSLAIASPFLNESVFDKTAANACRLMASSIIGALWPNGAKTFQIDLPTSKEGTEADVTEVREYYEWATKVMVEKMDHPQAGLLTGLEEYMVDQSSFGTSGMSAFENEDNWDVPVQYNSVNVKAVAIDEGENGFVDTVYNETELTIRQAVLKYGLDKLSAKSQETFRRGDSDQKIKVLHCIEPRIDGDPYGFGNKDFPIASVHIEVENEHVIKESGFMEMPIFVTRFWKTIGEKWGRSPATENMADILEVNAMREAAEIAVEKSLDPPLTVLDDGGLGGGVVDTSAGAINVRTVSGRLGNQKPIEPIYTVGELNTTYARITELKEDIKNGFFVDRLLDFNNEQRMTAYETSLRDGLRGQSLGTVYSRQMAELLVPLIQRTFHILYRRGILGVVKGSKLDTDLSAKGIYPRYVPDAIADMVEKGEDAYKITFISPAARILQNEEMLGIQKVTEYLLGLAPIIPSVLENFDEDFTIRRVQALSGAPAGILKPVDKVASIRRVNQRIQAQAMQNENNKQNSETARNMSQALGTAAQSGVLPQGSDDYSGLEQQAA